MTTVYKILSHSEWEAAVAAGAFAGSEVDLADGYIHFSGADTAQQTARLYFSGRDDLVIVAVSAESLGDALKWEPSRGGVLFPHLYGVLPVDKALEVRPLRLGADGAPQLGILAP